MPTMPNDNAERTMPNGVLTILNNHDMVGMLENVRMVASRLHRDRASQPLHNAGLPGQDNLVFYASATILAFSNRGKSSLVYASPSWVSRKNPAIASDNRKKYSARLSYRVSFGNEY